MTSALDYWIKLNQTGYTSDAYLTTPVGVNTLNFGAHAFKDLSAYATPDGVNSILQWTAVPAADVNDGLTGTSVSTAGSSGTGGSSTGGTTFVGPPTLIGSSQPRSYSRISVSNAIAAIEGEIAIQYLLKHNIFPIIDANHDGLITAQEIQTFTDNANNMGLPQAGAMARLLGGTDAAVTAGQTLFGGLSTDQPDAPDALQRRFNFFDYAVNGSLKGAIPVADFKVLRTRSCQARPPSSSSTARGPAPATTCSTRPLSETTPTSNTSCPSTNGCPRALWSSTATSRPPTSASAPARTRCSPTPSTLCSTPRKANRAARLRL